MCGPAKPPRWRRSPSCGRDARRAGRTRPAVTAWSPRVGESVFPDLKASKKTCHQVQTGATRSVGRPGADDVIVALLGIARARPELTGLTRRAPCLPDRPVVPRYRP